MSMAIVAWAELRGSAYGNAPPLLRISPTGPEGGSMRDHLSVEAVDKAGAAMIFTSRRHFRH